LRALPPKEEGNMVIATTYDHRRCDRAQHGLDHVGSVRDEERDLAARIAAGDRAARNRLVQANLGLVVSIARRFLDRGLDLEDLVGEGNLGLIRAAEEFDPRFGTRFSTYAVCWIKQAIRHALMHTATTIRVPERMVSLLIKWRRAEGALGNQLGRAPAFDETASYLGLTPDQKFRLAKALEAGRLRPGSRDDDRGVAELSERVMDQHGPAEERCQAEEERAVAWRLIGRLGDRERVIMTLRYGLEGESLTLEEIGRRLGVTRERVRQIETHALRKLGRGRIDPAFDSQRGGRRGPTACSMGGEIAR
jgi:RNA polymerase primary sigma factor